MSKRHNLSQQALEESEDDIFENLSENSIRDKAGARIRVFHRTITGDENRAVKEYRLSDDNTKAVQDPTTKDVCVSKFEGKLYRLLKKVVDKEEGWEAEVCYRSIRESFDSWIQRKYFFKYEDGKAKEGADIVGWSPEKKDELSYKYYGLHAFQK